MEQENEGTQKNPKAALDAIAAPAPITLSQLALLERIKSPLLYGKTGETFDKLTSVYVMKSGKKPSEILKEFKEERLQECAIDWAADKDVNTFIDDLADALDSIAAFWKMLPRPEADNGDNGKSKKEVASETGSSQS